MDLFGYSKLYLCLQKVRGVCVFGSQRAGDGCSGFAGIRRNNTHLAQVPRSKNTWDFTATAGDLLASTLQ